MMKNVCFIDTLKGVTDLVDWAVLQDTWKGDLEPRLYIDVEGERLSRYGNVSLLTILVYPGPGLERVHIIDIYTLKNEAFHVVGTRGKSLKDILESPDILKVFFDVRNDSDALYSQYGINLKGIRDLQLMESATRRNTTHRRLLSGLSRCIEFGIDGTEKEQWKRDKEKGEMLFRPEKGGSYSVFNKRPLSEDMLAYCVGDVQYLPALYRKYTRRTVRWANLIAAESQNRVSESQRANYKPDGPDKALSPWTRDQNALLDSWNEVNQSKGHFLRTGK